MDLESKELGSAFYNVTLLGYLASLSFLRWRMGMSLLQDWRGIKADVEVDVLCQMKCAEQVAMQNEPLVFQKRSQAP